MKRNIYPDRCQEVAELLGASDPRRVLVVPIDVAKREHVVQVCRASGEFLFSKPMFIRNDGRGAAYLMKRLKACCSRYGIARSHVLLGAEDPPSYTVNFINTLNAAGWTFVRVNAKEAKRFRTNTVATSDTLALNGIAQAIINRRAYECARQDEVYQVMKTAGRTRRRFVRAETAAKNRIHKCIDVLFPGFLDQGRAGLTPFGPPCLALMENDFSVLRIRRMRQATLAKRLAKAGVQKPLKKTQKLKALSETALSPPADVVGYMSRTLSVHVNYLRAVRESIAGQHNEMARCLVQTPGFLMTSIPGVGITLAAGIAGEYCRPVELWPPADTLACYAGIVAKEFETGGSEAEPARLGLPRQTNRILRDYVLQAAWHAGTTPHPVWRQLQLPGAHPLMQRCQQARDEQQKHLLATGKSLLRIGRRMFRSGQIYLPRNAIHPNAPGAMEPALYIEYHRRVADMFQGKWKRSDLGGIPDRDNHLHRWLEDIEQLVRFGRTRST